MSKKIAAAVTGFTGRYRVEDGYFGAAHFAPVVLGSRAWQAIEDTASKKGAVINHTKKFSVRVVTKNFKGSDIRLEKVPTAQTFDSTMVYYKTKKFGNIGLCREGIKAAFNGKVPRRIYVQVKV